MKTYTSFQNINKNCSYFSLAIGNFDGVHEGHKKLLKSTVEDARANNGISGVFTFWPHPLKTLKSNQAIKLLSGIDRKKQLIAETGIDYALFVPFTQEIMTLTAEQFVKEILIDKLKVSSVHVGFNFTFGKNAISTANDLIEFGKRYGFNVDILPEVNICGDSVSSTLIRQYIEDGEIEQGNKLLGYNYSIEGTVVTGDQRGRQIGFPTANVEIQEELILPAIGVYAAKVYTENNVYKSVLNIGNKPTFGVRSEISIEAHLLGFKGDLYGKNVKVEFVKRLRGEKKFSSVDDLIKQINVDVTNALEVL